MSPTAVENMYGKAEIQTNVNTTFSFMYCFIVPKHALNITPTSLSQSGRQRGWFKWEILGARHINLGQSIAEFSYIQLVTIRLTR